MSMVKEPLNRSSVQIVARKDRQGQDLKRQARSGALASSAVGLDATFSAACPSVARAVITCAMSAVNASIKSVSRAFDILRNS